MDVQTFSGPCETRIQVFQGECIAGFLIVQTSVNDKSGLMSPCIRKKTVADHAAANKLLNNWKRGG